MLLRGAVVAVIIPQNLTRILHNKTLHASTTLCFISYHTRNLSRADSGCIGLSLRDNYRWFVLGAGAKRDRRRGARRRGRRHTTWPPSSATRARRT